MTFAFLEGLTVQATSDIQLVAALRRAVQGRLPHLYIEDFMDELARSVYVLSGRPVRTRTVREFLFDLQLYGLLRPVSDPWDAYELEVIRRGLRGPIIPPGWHHQLIWSSQLPFVVSSGAGHSLYRCLTLAELRTPKLQLAWVSDHLSTLSLYH